MKKITKNITIILLLLSLVIIVSYTFINRHKLGFGEIIELQNPQNCVRANSQCNVCDRVSFQNGEWTWNCTFATCENEVFKCSKYENKTINVTKLKHSNCKSAKSQCNECFREHHNKNMTCSEAVCPNEKFKCTEYF